MLENLNGVGLVYRVSDSESNEKRDGIELSPLNELWSSNVSPGKASRRLGIDFELRAGK
jgi:hypothetical protein